MDIYLLSDRFMPEAVLSNYESFIWAERYIPDHDFEMVMSKEDADTSSVQVGGHLSHSETHRICVVTTREDFDDEYGSKMTRWTGISLEKWLFQRRSAFRTLMPTYSWAKAPHSSVSIETYRGATTGRNHFVNPHFLVGDSVEPYFSRDSTSTDDDITGNLRVGNGVVSLSGVTTPKVGSRLGYGYVMTRQRITAGQTAPQFTFSITVEDVHLTPGARVFVYIDFYNSTYTRIESMRTFLPNIYADGTYSNTTPKHTFNPSYYTVYFLIDNRETTAHPAIEDCSATFHSPVLNAGTAPGHFFAGDMSYLMLNPQRLFTGKINTILDNIIYETVLTNSGSWTQDLLPLIDGYPPGVPLGGYNAAPVVDIPDAVVEVYVGPGNVFETLKSVCEEYDLGWGIFLNPSTGGLYISTFGGTDRTVRAEGNTYVPILYAPEIDTFQDVSVVSSVENRYNLAAVYGKFDFVICDIHGSTVEHQEYAHMDREILVVDASDVDLSHKDPALKDVLVSRGRAALAEHQRIMTLDGKVTENVPYIYEQQFAVGSMVTVRDSNGFEAEMRIDEYIFVSDKEGYRSYPTLKENRYINPGTWEAVKSSLVWNAAEGVWQDQ